MMGQSKSRRDFLGVSATAAFMSTALSMPRSLAAAAPSTNQYHLQPAAKAGSDLVDFGDGFADLYAFNKATATFADQPVFGGLLGTFYALINEDMVPLFGYAGYRLNQARIVEPGPGEPVRRLDIRMKEAFLYLDLATGKRLEQWKNPFTGETVEAYPWLADDSCTTATAERSSNIFSADAFTSNRYGGRSERQEQPAKTVSYTVPWRRVGDRYLGATHSYTGTRNPVTPEGWPKASSGEFVTQHEHLIIFADAKAMDDPNAMHAPATGSLSRKMPWLPFMRMGQSGVAGGLLALAHYYKITGTIDDVPPPLRLFLEREHPEHLRPMTSWDHNVMKPSSTLHYFARTVPPETPGYQPQE